MQPSPSYMDRCYVPRAPEFELPARRKHKNLSMHANAKMMQCGPFVEKRRYAGTQRKEVKIYKGR
jgi:hypothetical protein